MTYTNIHTNSGTQAPPVPKRRPPEPKRYPTLSIKKVCAMIEESCGNVCITERHGKECGNYAVILPEAMQELTTIVSYRRRSPMNVNEQKFGGYGHILRNPAGGMITVVKHFIEVPTVNRNPIGAGNLGPNGELNPALDFLDFVRTEFFRTEKQFNTDAYGFEVDPFMKLCGGSEFVLEGHTHPDLGVFWSSTDRRSGAHRAGNRPLCIFVCDPVRGEMLCSMGRGFEDVQVLVYERAAQSAQAQELPLPPAGELERMAGACLRTRGYDGSLRIRTTLRGRTCLKLRLVMPKVRREKDL